MSRIRKIITLAVVTAMFSLVAAPGSSVLAQTAIPQPRIHKRWTKMAAKANMLHARLPGEIEAAKKSGKDVTAAEKHKAEGDKMLNEGHLRLAVKNYEEAEKALK